MDKEFTRADISTEKMEELKSTAQKHNIDLDTCIDTFVDNVNKYPDTYMDKGSSKSRR